MTAHAERHRRRATGSRIAADEDLDAGADGRPPPSPASGFAADGEGGYILPGFLPAFDAAAALVKMLDLLARSGRAAGRGPARAARRCTWSTRPW